MNRNAKGGFTLKTREQIEARDMRELEKRRRQLNTKPLKYGLVFAVLAVLMAAGIDSISSGIDN